MVLLGLVFNPFYSAKAVEVEEFCDTNADEEFDDVDCDHWAAEAIYQLLEEDKIEGRDDDEYEPDEFMNRAEFVKLIIEMEGVDVSDYEHEDEPYLDVASNDWFRDYVRAAFYLDVIEHGTSFRPDDAVNRAEAVKMLIRLSGEETNSSETSFSDVDDDAWYAKYVEKAEDDEIVDGYSDDTFRPYNALTRAEAAVIVVNAEEENWF